VIGLRPLRSEPSVRAKQELERLGRHFTRPAIANECIKRNCNGRVVLQLKRAYRDGTTHIVLSPLEFMQRLAALVPRPRLYMIRFHGVLAPNAKLRSGIVPGPADNTSEHASHHAHSAPSRMSWARLLKRVFDNTSLLSSGVPRRPMKSRLTMRRYGDRLTVHENGGLKSLYAAHCISISVSSVGKSPSALL
jgi:Putative transposase